jgi:tripartite-type tricarboxylate transporter receptor subunit TctC
MIQTSHKHYTRRLLSRRAVLKLAAISAFTLGAARHASAQPPFPNRPIRLVAPFSAGGALDLIARLVARCFTTQMGQACVVENMPGAAGVIGSKMVLKAVADGYTLLLGSTTTHGINPVLYRPPPYDAERDFAPISLIATIPHVLIVSPSLPVNNLADFIAYIKSHPGTAFGSAGIGSPHHLAGELLRKTFDADLVHVAYKGSSSALNDLMGGQFAFMSIEYTAAAEAIKAGRVKAIALAADKRLPGVDIPTYAEQGVKGIEITAWYALFAPAHTPQPIVEQLSAEVVKGLQTKEFRDTLSSQGATPVGGTPEQLASFVKSELELWSGLVKSSGATAG